MANGNGDGRVSVRDRLTDAAEQVRARDHALDIRPAFHLDTIHARVVEHRGIETTRQTPNEVGVSYKFLTEKPISEYSFIYETPAAIVRLPVGNVHSRCMPARRPASQPTHL